MRDGGQMLEAQVKEEEDVVAGGYSSKRRRCLLPSQSALPPPASLGGNLGGNMSGTRARGLVGQQEDREDIDEDDDEEEDAADMNGDGELDIAEFSSMSERRRFVLETEREEDIHTEADHEQHCETDCDDTDACNDAARDVPCPRAQAQDKRFKRGVTVSSEEVLAGDVNAGHNCTAAGVGRGAGGRGKGAECKGCGTKPGCHKRGCDALRKSQGGGGGPAARASRDVDDEQGRAMPLPLRRLTPLVYQC